MTSIFKNRTWIPVSLALIAVAWVESRGPGAPSSLRLTDPKGVYIVVQTADIYMVKASSQRIANSPHPMTRLSLSGKKSIDVREALSEVMAYLGGDWAQLHVPGKSISASESGAPVFVRSASIVSVQPAPYRLDTSRRRMSDLHFRSGSGLRVIEDAQSVARLLGMRA